MYWVAVAVAAADTQLVRLHLYIIDRINMDYESARAREFAKLR